jgi:hypothetical protein
MRQYLLTLIFWAAFISVHNISVAQPFNSADSSHSLKKINISYMLRGYFYAASSIKDTLSLGGFGGSNNRPKIFDNSSRYAAMGSSPVLTIDTVTDAVFSNNFEGYKMILANQSGKTIQFPASDSRLSMIAEVFIGEGWQPIEYLPLSWCGNSYHTLYLKDNEYWEFIIPRYYGKIKVKLRYKLKGMQNEVYYSNEIAAYINKKQLAEKQGHKPQGLMDPYND